MQVLMSQPGVPIWSTTNWIVEAGHQRGLICQTSPFYLKAAKAESIRALA